MVLLWAAFIVTYAGAFYGQLDFQDTNCQGEEDFISGENWGRNFDAILCALIELTYEWTIEFFYAR